MLNISSYTTRLLAFLLPSIATGTSIRTTKAVENLVVFGDSYSDEGRLAYFQAHNGTAPPAGTVIPTANVTASGGYTWPHFASQQLGATTYNYAVSGAACSNEIIYRHLESINGPFPSVIDYEIPAFLADAEYASGAGNGTFFSNRRPDNTVYALWIGTNDLGVDAFLTDSQQSGTTISNFTDCIWSAFDAVYATGGRRFVLFDEAPLDKSPLYASPQNGGAGDNQYWLNKTAYNTTEAEQKMLEYTTSANKIFSYGVPFQLLVEARWPGASFSILNIHQLFSDIYSNPSAYLDAPANPSAPYRGCSVTAPNNVVCTTSENSPSSFLWYDELHPSSRADEIIAAEFISVLQQTSEWYVTRLQRLTSTIVKA
ncbi:carbohydrate esterase family 16 protein [Daldinia decipiens]|uniref:carbohydrate esterase family 16 protein n=1 Tax=Daldinia decipiens TaxID=326647 RepID=UPI0020C4BA52|nr:carbohydrate esterase family 16 protein [Daldinia decipiens]KAI1655131.1 carbohydrate esterase family 16 protein [Daldinia decipiens]